MKSHQNYWYVCTCSFHWLTNKSIWKPLLPFHDLHCSYSFFVIPFYSSLFPSFLASFLPCFLPCSHPFFLACMLAPVISHFPNFPLLSYFSFSRSSMNCQYQTVYRDLLRSLLRACSLHPNNTGVGSSTSCTYVSSITWYVFKCDVNMRIIFYWNKLLLFIHDESWLIYDDNFRRNSRFVSD